MTEKKTITERSLIIRLSRELKKDGLLLKSCSKDSHLFSDLGHYYTFNTRTYAIESTHIDPFKLASELNLLKNSEEVILKS